MRGGGLLLGINNVVCFITDINKKKPGCFNKIRDGKKVKYILINEQLLVKYAMPLIFLSIGSVWKLFFFFTFKQGFHLKSII